MRSRSAWSNKRRRGGRDEQKICVDFTDTKSMKIQMDKIYRARKYYFIGMVLMVLAGYALTTCGSLLFKLTDSFPTVPLAIAALLLIIYNVVAVSLYVRLVKTQQSALVRFYLSNKVIRMLFAFAVIMAALIIGRAEAIAFVVSFFVLYILTIIYESVFFVQIEKKINENK